MASLVLKMSVPLDGYVAPIETPARTSSAPLPTTYAGWAGYWPDASGPFAKPMNEIPKVMFSNSLASAPTDTCSPTARRGSPGR